MRALDHANGFPVSDTQGAQTLVPPDLEVAHTPFERGGAYPGVFLFTGMGRLVRPVRQLPSGLPGAAWHPGAGLCRHQVPRRS